MIYNRSFSFRVNYFFPPILLIINIITAIIAITIKIPTPIPALKIPSTTSQLENEINTIISINILVNLLCMISVFLNCFYVVYDVNQQWFFYNIKVLKF